MSATLSKTVPIPVITSGFVLDVTASNQDKSNPPLVLQIPCGSGNSASNFWCSASGTLKGQGTWTFGLCLSQPPLPFVPPSARFGSWPPSPTFAPVQLNGTASYSAADSNNHTWTLTANVVVGPGNAGDGYISPGGIPNLSGGSTWSLVVDGTTVASGTISNFPTFIYNTDPLGNSNPTDNPEPNYGGCKFTTKIRGTLVCSLDLVALPSGGSTSVTLTATGTPS
jgi:hypothetical protein